MAAVDEAIHYTPRKAGYHGGASPAEVVVPVITLLPVRFPAPGRLGRLRRVRPRPRLVGRARTCGRNPRRTRQAQRRSRTVPAAGQAQAPRSSGRRRRRALRCRRSGGARRHYAGRRRAADPGTAAATGPGTVGSRVAASARMASQRQFVRRAPDDAKRRRAHRRPGPGRRPPHRGRGGGPGRRAAPSAWSDTSPRSRGCSTSTATLCSAPPRRTGRSS